jgi:hypothetical protein
MLMAAMRIVVQVQEDVIQQKNVRACANTIRIVISLHGNHSVESAG